MTLSPDAALIFLGPVTLLCLLAAYSDLSQMKLPNRLVIALAILYAALGPLVLSFETYLWGYLHGLIMYGVGMFAFFFMGVGAGDGKFAAAMALYIPLTDAPSVLFLLAIFTLSCFGAHRVARAVPAIRQATPNWKSWTSQKFPFGFALASTMVCYLGLAAFG